MTSISTSSLIESYVVAAVHHVPGVDKQPSCHSISLAFSRDASILLSAQSDSSLLLYNATTSKQINAYRQLELGISLIEPTHQRYAVVCAPARKGHSKHQKKMSGIDANRLYTWDLHTNTIVGYLKGHTDDIQSMASCLADESIVSTDVNGAVRLWDLRTGSTCVACTNVGSQVPCAATLNRRGTLLAVAGGDATNRPQVNVFDRRALRQGPLSTTYHREWDTKSKSVQLGGKGTQNGFSRIKFCNDDSMMVVTPFEQPRAKKRAHEDRPPLHTILSNTADGSTSYTVDADLDGDKKYYRPEASFSSDSKHIIFGDEGKNIQVWEKFTNVKAMKEDYKKEPGSSGGSSGSSSSSGSSGSSGSSDSSDGSGDSGSGAITQGGLRRVALWTGHISSIGPIRWSPKTDLVASGGGNLLMWLPQDSQAVKKTKSTE